MSAYADTNAVRRAMPTNTFTASELGDSELLIKLLIELEKRGASDDDIEEALLLFAAEPLQHTLKQDIGPKRRLSIPRLQREAAARWHATDDAWVTVYIRYGYRLDWLPAVVKALDPPEEIETTVGGHVFTGEEAVLLLLRRYRSTDPLYSMTSSFGNSHTAASYTRERTQGRSSYNCTVGVYTRSWSMVEVVNTESRFQISFDTRFSTA